MLRLALTVLKRRRALTIQTQPSVAPTGSPAVLGSSPPVPIGEPSASPPPPLRVFPNHQTTAPDGNHRGRILAMRLSHSRLCSVQRAARLEQYGVSTLGDLAYGDLPSIAGNFAATAKALRQLQRYRLAIRLAASVPSLCPADALALVSIHRQHPRSIAAQTPAALRRDLQRFADSSRGQTLLRGRPVPSIRRIKRWIAAASDVLQPGEMAAA